MSVDAVKLGSSSNTLLKDIADKFGLDAVIVATSEGLELASYIKNNEVDAESVSADIATILALTMGLMRNIGKKPANNIILEANDGIGSITTAGSDIALGLVAPSGYKLGQLKLAIKELDKRVREL